MGKCEDCFYLIQELHIEPIGGERKISMHIDRWCQINQVFKRLDGFCDMWEEK